MLTDNSLLRRCWLVLLMLAPGLRGAAQPMTLEEAIGTARLRSVPALEARASFVSDYWAWRAYQASRLPSLTLIGELGNLNRSWQQSLHPDKAEYVYVRTNNLQNGLTLQATQNVALTGGTLSLATSLYRTDELGTKKTNWNALPVRFSYTQPLFSYNEFKWDKLISPKAYEKAKRVYMETMEDVTLSAVQRYFGVMEAQKLYEVAKTNYDNTSRMLTIARERLALGSVTRDEYLQLELRMLSDSLSISENGVSLREARMQLNSLLGLDETREVVPVLEESLPAVVMDYDLVLRKTAENSSFHLANDISLLEAESAVARAKADRGISLQLNAAFGLSAVAPDLRSAYAGTMDQEVVGLSFAIPILDWGRGRGRVKKAEAAADVVRAQVEQAENDKRISLFTAVGQFNNQRQLCDVSRRASAIAQERYELVMEKFRSGKASVTDLNTARSESDSAIQKYVQDISRFWTYYYTLRKLTLYDFLTGDDLTVNYEEMTQ
ncbi:Outer membrane protein TolC [Bacteroidales bacterium WCE2004]|nr:Outer membrane protein TolC [Bacteroidales bacterium WCE2004]